MKNLSAYLPLDKSWIIRLGVLDILHNRKQIITFLENQKNLSTDLQALLHVASEWNTQERIHLGESGTLYRFLQFASWKLLLQKEFIREKTLLGRKITSNPSIINFSQTELLKLDQGTSQWASAAVLLGDTERVHNPPYKLAITYEAIAHWNERTTQGKDWEPRYDKTIEQQAQAFTTWIHTSKMQFQPEQAEDYCFARAFRIITKEKGAKRWPSLAGHESNRLLEMETAIQEAEHKQPISSQDHRVVQAIAMRYHMLPLIYLHPEAVNKSWPEFWNFLQTLKNK